MNRAADSALFARLRQKMIDEQLLPREITDAAVIRAMQSIPRELFVPSQYRDNSYSDGPLDIGFGQTISQPYIVASMIQKLNVTGDSRILEIGTGSGYQTAVLAQIVARVFTVELIPELAARSREVLSQLGIANVEFRVGDGKLSWPEAAPFDGILVGAAAANDVPTTWLDQLATGGHLVVPVTVEAGRQDLRLYTKTPAGIEWRTQYEVRFVPLR